MSFSEFMKRSCPDDEIDIIPFFENFRPASVDPERLFSCGRLFSSDENLSAKLSDARKSFEKRIYQEKHTPVGVTEISVSYLSAKKGFNLEFIFIMLK